MPTKGIVFQVKERMPDQLYWLMKEFRLMVNKTIRVGLDSKVTSRYKLCGLVYQTYRREHSVYSQYVPSVVEVACLILKNRRKAIRKGADAKIPYARRLSLKLENQGYKLNRQTGELDVPIRAHEHLKLQLVLSDYHRGFLLDESYSLGSLTICPERVIIAFRKEAPKPYVPKSVISLDTNERSLDGVMLTKKSFVPVKAEYSEVAVIQEHHQERRRKLQKKKAHDRRTSKKLTSEEGRREHNRVEYRLHQVANVVIEFAKDNKSMIVLEDLTGIKSKWKSKKLNRRISNWPRRELHRLIEYKAEWNGVPIEWRNPVNSSRRCPRCGKINKSRLGNRDRYFCKECGWSINRHINAGLNLLQPVLVEHPELRGLRFDLDVLQHDAMKTLYSDDRTRSESNGVSKS